MKNRRMTTFAMVYTIFMCIFLLFLAAGVLVSGIGARRAVTDAEETVRSRMAYTMAEFTAEIQRITASVRTMYGNRDISWVTTNPGLYYMDYELAAALIRIEEHKTALENGSALIRGAKVFIPSIGMVLQDSYGSVGNFYKQSAQEMQAYSESIRFGKIFIENGAVMIGYPFAPVERQLTLMVLIELNAARITDDLSHAFINYNSHYRFSLADGAFVLTSLPQGDAPSASDYMVSEIADVVTGAVYTVYVPNSEILGEYRAFLLLAAAMTAMFLLCSVGFFFVAKRLVHRPMRRLMTGFSQMEKGAFPVVIQEKGSRDFSYIYGAFNQMNEKLHRLIDLTYKQKILLRESELKQLQAQINPHFLYNTLFLMNTLIRSDESEKALMLSGELGQYYQYITRNASDSVPLCEENKHARIYCDIQAARFDGRITSEYGELHERMRLLPVPRLMIQPLIENAYTYGLSEKTSDGRLRVSFCEYESGCGIIIEDNGDDLTDERLQALRDSLSREDGGEVTGSINIDRRVRIMFAPGSGLVFSRSELGGLSAEIRLMFKRGKEA